ncbi:ACYPI004315 protein [Aphis craccivora]|uniref:ACYPI004315 protein n=1 Tax=Aphis craccivora TaxID=307492 RepID=A0A6G0YXH6_APHCR|nr:ACYPI004315 protein [Aphis craccivora]
MTNPHSLNTNVYQGGGHFEFSSEKNWGVEQEDFKIFDSIDMTHLAASIASVPFNIQHDIPVELFTTGQLEEFEVESSLALSRHTSQCNSKLLSIKTVLQTSTENSQAPTDTNKLYLNNSEVSNVPFGCEIQSNMELEEILGNRKPLFNILQDEQKSVTSINKGEADSIITESQKMSIKDDNTIKIINHNAGHWLDSMLDSDE